MKVKFKKQRKLGTVNFLGRPMTKRKPMPRVKGYSKLRFADSIVVPRPTSVSLFSPSMNRPAKRFYGDTDRDGVMNGLDCEPYNKKKQGPYHRKTLTNAEVDSLFKAGGTLIKHDDQKDEEYKKHKEEHDEIEERARKRMTAKQRKAYFADDNDDNTEVTPKKISEAMEAEDRYGELYREEESKRCDMCGVKGKKLKPDRINPKLYKVCHDCVDADERGEETQPMDWAR